MKIQWHLRKDHLERCEMTKFKSRVVIKSQEVAMRILQVCMGDVYCLS